MPSIKETDVAKVAESFAEFKWPFEKGEADEEKLAKLVWNARRSEEAALDKVKESADKVTEIQTELDAEKARKSGTDEDGQEKIKDLTKQVRDLEASNTALAAEKTKLETDGRPADKLENDRLSIALQLGLSERSAKRLVGENRDELLEDAKAFAEEHGIELESDDEDDQGDDTGGDNTPPARQPVLNLRTGAGGGKVRVASDTAAAGKALPPLW